jgi:TPR repeat protein
LDGRGVEQDISKATNLFRLVVYRGDQSQGVAECLYALAWSYCEESKYELAIPLLKQASDAEHISAPHAIGLLYENGFGVPQNDDEAKKWYHLGIKRGCPKAHVSLGDMYLRPLKLLGYPKENSNTIITALKLFEQASKINPVYYAHVGWVQYIMGDVENSRLSYELASLVGSRYY